MKLFSFFKKSGVSEMQNIVRLNDGSIEYVSQAPKISTPHMSYRMFEGVSVVYDAVDKIASRVSSLSLVTKNQEKEVVQSPEIEVFQKNKTKLWLEMSTSLELTGECFVVLRGRVDRPPLEMQCIEPFAVSSGEAKIGQEMPDSIRTDSLKDRRTYYNQDGRYISQDGLNELLPIVKRSRMNTWRGLSKLSPLVQEVLHIDSGNSHNSALLRNGLKNSIILSPTEGDIDIEEGNALKDTLERYHKGSNNAGKPLILPRSFALVSTAGNTRDMDYMALIDTDENRIYRIFNVPLPLVKSGTMTQSNYEVAIPFLYTDAVIPAFSFIAEALTEAVIKNRYKSKNILTYDEFNIPALNLYQVSLMRSLKETGSVSVNEVRSRGGYAPVDGGDEVMVNSGSVKLSDMDSESWGYNEAE